MLKRIVMLAICLFSSLLIVQAQQTPPEPINQALANLSGLVNQNVTLNDVFWSFEQIQFPDTSLGCPQPGVMYSQVVTLGFRFLITYNNVDYDYRVTADGRFTILCSTVTSTQAAPQCPPPDQAGWLPPRLTLGGFGRVIPGNLPNNVRDVPGQSGNLIGEIQPGQTFTITEGPVCTSLDRLIWWRVNAFGLEGWTTEGLAPDYYLEPIDAAGNPLVTPPPGLDLPDLSLPLLTSLQPIASAQGQESLINLSAISPTAPLVAVTPADGSLQIINYQTGEDVVRVSPFEGGISALAFGFSSAELRSYFAAGSPDGSLRAWEQSFEGTFTDLPALPRGTSGITALSFGEDSILAAGAEDSTVSLFNVSTGQLISLLAAPAEPAGPVRGIRFTRDAVVVTYSTGLVQVFAAVG
jgi:hypothetical protein